MSRLTAHVALPAGVSAIPVARRAVHRILHGWGYTQSDWLYQAELVASELVSNAVRHAGGCTAIEVSGLDGDVTVSAIDGSVVLPSVREPEIGGRGLFIVNELSRAWGTDIEGDGKCVWATLHRYPPLGR